jgi:hypothetical protein
MNTNEIVLAIDAEISRLQQAKALLTDTPSLTHAKRKPGPTSLLCGGDPCTACVTHPAALSGHDIKFRRFGADCLAAPDAATGRPGVALYLTCRHYYVDFPALNL